MPTYFFDVRDGSELARDEVGVDLPDLNAALVEAKTSLADIAREVVRSDGASGQLVIEIRDGADVVGHAELTLRAAIKPLSIS